MQGAVAKSEGDTERVTFFFWHSMCRIYLEIKGKFLLSYTTAPNNTKWETFLVAG